MSKQTNVYLLLSGGFDSCACLDIYKARGNSVSCLFVNYNQPNMEKEKKSAQLICNRYDSELSMIDVGCSFSKHGYMKGRNAFLLSIAFCSMPESCSLLSMGVHNGSEYPDCTEAFRCEMQKVLDLYSDGTVQIDFPLVNWHKQQIYDYHKLRGIPSKILTTSYRP